jgi:transcription initiation factor TFIIH subunit 4
MSKLNIKMKCSEESNSFFRLNKMSVQFANLQEYIASLPPNVTQNIYGHPASCLAIFRFVK